ncbi:MAG: hypothetical protein WC707_01060 [Candidatus Babeliaceae bacterium]|jgi:hypothetical protein
MKKILLILTTLLSATSASYAMDTTKNIEESTGKTREEKLAHYAQERKAAAKLDPEIKSTINIRIFRKHDTKASRLSYYSAFFISSYKIVCGFFTPKSRQVNSKNIILAEMQQSKKILVYHGIGRGGTLESIKQHGLLSLNELYKRGLTDKKPVSGSVVFPDQYDVIYFRYSPSYDVKKDTVSMEVDLGATYVHNQEFRALCNSKYWQQYKDSKISLSAFIANREKAEVMRKNKPQGCTVIFDPITSEPFYVTWGDARINNYLYVYIPEVIVEQHEIKPEKLIFQE